MDVLAAAVELTTAAAAPSSEAAPIPFEVPPPPPSSVDEQPFTGSNCTFCRANTEIKDLPAVGPCYHILKIGPLRKKVKILFRHCICASCNVYREFMTHDKKGTRMIRLHNSENTDKIRSLIKHYYREANKEVAEKEFLRSFRELTNVVNFPWITRIITEPLTCACGGIDIHDVPKDEDGLIHLGFTPYKLPNGFGILHCEGCNSLFYQYRIRDKEKETWNRIALKGDTQMNLTKLQDTIQTTQSTPGAVYFTDMYPAGYSLLEQFKRRSTTSSYERHLLASEKPEFYGEPSEKKRKKEDESSVDSLVGPGTVKKVRFVEPTAESPPTAGSVSSNPILITDEPQESSKKRKIQLTQEQKTIIALQYYEMYREYEDIPLDISALFSMGIKRLWFPQKTVPDRVYKYPGRFTCFRGEEHEVTKTPDNSICYCNRCHYSLIFFGDKTTVTGAKIIAHDDVIVCGPTPPRVKALIDHRRAVTLVHEQVKEIDGKIQRIPEEIRELDLLSNSETEIINTELLPLIYQRDQVNQKIETLELRKENYIKDYQKRRSAMVAEKAALDQKRKEIIDSNQDIINAFKDNVAKFKSERV
jgi:hypothetical protein